jgi:hypothetical protein
MKLFGPPTFDPKQKRVKKNEISCLPSPWHFHASPNVGLVVSQQNLSPTFPFLPLPKLRSDGATTLAPIAAVLWRLSQAPRVPLVLWFDHRASNPSGPIDALSDIELDKLSADYVLHCKKYSQCWNSIFCSFFIFF